MSERPTPETDATVEESFHRINFPTSPVPAEFAKRLENERDEARQELENYKAQSIHTCHDQCQRPMCVLRRERDAERDLADRLAAALMSTDSIIRKEVSLIGQWSSPDVCKEALAAWKEVRKEH